MLWAGGSNSSRVKRRISWPDFLETNQTPVKWVPGFLAGVNRPGREAGQLSPPSADMNEWSYTSTPPYAFMACMGKTLIFYFRILKNKIGY